MTLGARIAKLRRVNDIKQEDLARQIGLHITHLSRLENDKMKPRAKTLARIASAFSMTVDQLLEDEDNKDKAPTFHDPRLQRLVAMVQELDDEDQHIVDRMVHALVTKKRMETALSR